MFIKLKENLRIYFVGIGQIMLQENAFTGLLFTVGVLYNSVIMRCILLFSSIIGTELAKLFKYDRDIIKKGLYGFNAALVGVAIVVFLKLNLVSIVILILALAITTLFQHFFIKHNVSVFTLPFVIVTYLFILICNTYFSHLIKPASFVNATNSIDIFYAFKGFAQVIFQNNTISGIIFFIAVFISSPIAALYGFAASVIAALVFYFLSIPISDINMGIYSFNALLCAITFSGLQFKNSLLSIYAVIFSIIISLIMYKFQLLPLTLPFVVSCSILTIIKNKKIFLL